MALLEETLIVVQAGTSRIEIRARLIQRQRKTTQFTRDSQRMVPDGRFGLIKRLVGREQARTVQKKERTLLFAECLDCKDVPKSPSKRAEIAGSRCDQ